MDKFNLISIHDLEAMHEAVGMEFVVEDGEIKKAFIPEERIRS